MMKVLGDSSSRSVRSRVLLVVINLLSLGCLIWTLRDARLSELGDDLASMNWWWVGLAAVADIGVYLWHGMRWGTLLRPVMEISYWEPVRAIYIGLFANEVLPFRIGEVLRCYVLTKRTGLPLSVSITSALIERVFDGIWLCLCLIVMLRILPLEHSQPWLVEAGYGLGLSVFVVALVLGIAMFRRHKTRAALSGGSAWQRQFRVLIDDLEIMGHSRYLFSAFLQSLPYLLLMTVPIYASFKGYGFDLSLGVAFTLMVVLRFGTIVPQAPGNLGLFQFLVKESLEKVFNVVPDEAARFSLVLWGIVTLPLLIGGLISLSVTGLKLGALRKEAHSERAELARRNSTA
jgi:glycosyltransferase 2 family protein